MHTKLWCDDCTIKTATTVHVEQEYSMVVDHFTSNKTLLQIQQS